MKRNVAGVEIPDSTLARAAYEHVRGVESALLFQHALRVYVFGALTGLREARDAADRSVRARHGASSRDDIRHDQRRRARQMGPGLPAPQLLRSGAGIGMAQLAAADCDIRKPQ